ncbi:MAG: hypothetical protein N2112_03630 [Gemmataceae bacterium]|jgi:hypothetical protein|nr:hypothetical protein [Gemmataceae bacterium]
MVRTAGLAILLSFVAMSSLQADVPLDKGLKYVDPVLAFEGVEKYPDYVFLIRFTSFSGSPVGVKPTLKPVQNEKPFAMGAQRRLSETQLLAVPKKLYEQKSKDTGSDAWLSEKVEGVLVAPFDTPSTVGKTTDKEAPVNKYTVSIVDGKLIVKSEAKKRTDASPSRLVPLWVVGLVGASSILWLGLWAIRRNKAHPQPPVNPCSPQ